MGEIDIQNSIRIALSSHGCVVRLQSGTFYQGQLSTHPITHKPILINIRAVKVGLDGLPDLIHLGDNGRVGFIEVKSEHGKASDVQKRFLAWLTARNIPCGIARSVADALRIIGVHHET